MPVIVTIEGSVNPCADLRRGERRTVELTDWVRKLVRGGYAIIVARHGDPEETPAAEDEPEYDEPAAEDEPEYDEPAAEDEPEDDEPEDDED